MRKLFRKTLERLKHFAAFAKMIIVNHLSLEHSIIYKAANIVAAEKIEGDYLEFGVYSGGSLKDAYYAIKGVFSPYQKYHDQRTGEDLAEIGRIWNDMRFFAFDSFRGLPHPNEFDKESKDFAEGKYCCTEDVFHKNLAKDGVPLNKVVTISGLFEETCNPDTIAQYGMKKASIIHIDCDYYASTLTVLDFVKPLLTDGTVIIFDDWYCFRGNPNLGEQRAFHEWTATMTDWIFTEYQKAGPWSNSFIANKRYPV